MVTFIDHTIWRVLKIILEPFTIDTPKDLISKLLIVDPKKRYTVDDALNHEFFQILVSGFSNSRVWLLTNVAILTKLTLTTFDSCSVSVFFCWKLLTNSHILPPSHSFPNRAFLWQISVKFLLILLSIR